MNAKQIVAAILFLDFAALNVWAFSSAGLDGLVEFVTTLSPWGYVVAADVVIALSMVLVWLFRDARQNGRNPFGYALITALTGSLGPLLYLATSRDRANAA